MMRFRSLVHAAVHHPLDPLYCGAMEEIRSDLISSIAPQ